MVSLISMKFGSMVLLVCGLVLISGIFIPGAAAINPLWTVPASPGDQLSMVVVSQDGSTIVAGGDQLIVLSPDGKKRWSGWSSALLDISRDGRYIATSQAQTVRLFSGSGTLLWTQSIGTPVTDLSMSPDGGIIAASGSGIVQTFYNSGIGLGANGTPMVNHIKISPNKDQIIITTEKDLRRVNLSIVPEWYDTNSTQDLVAISGDGTLFVTATFNRIRLYYGSGALLWDRTITGGNTLALAFSRDGSTIVTGRDDKTVRVMDKNGTLLWTATTGDWVQSVAVSDDGSTVLAGSRDRNLYVYDRAGTLLGTFTANAPISSHSVAVSGDGSVIAVVDTSAVYGFSRSQFTPPAPVTTPATTVPAITVTASPIPATSPPVAVPSSLATPKACISWTVPALSLTALVFLCRKRD
jgi:WD40 repeat protein